MSETYQHVSTLTLRRTGALALVLSLLVPGVGQVATADDASNAPVATREADGISKALVDKSLEETNPDLTCVLAQNAGTMIVRRCTLSKSGDATRPTTGLVSSANACAAAQGDGATVALSQSAMDTAGDDASGIVADNDAHALAYQTRVSTASSGSCGVAASNGGKTLGSELTVSTDGRQSPGVEAGAGSGLVSLTSSSVTTAGTGSPVALVRGRMDLVSVDGAARQSSIATIEDAGSLLVVKSNLSSERTTSGHGARQACGIDICGTDAGEGHDRAHFMALSSSLHTSMRSGAMLFAHDASADILLDGCTLDYDSATCDLMHAQDGADMRLVARGMELAGDTSASDGSSAKLYLSDDTTWIGQPKVNATADAAGLVSVCVDETSNWVVPASCTVHDLAVAPGGIIVDEQGESVSVEVGGTRVTHGTSAVTVSVTGAYATSAELPSFAQESVRAIDRAEFDDEFGTQTAVDTNLVTRPHTPMAPSTLDTSAAQGNLLDLFIDWVKQTMGV